MRKSKMLASTAVVHAAPNDQGSETEDNTDVVSISAAQREAQAVSEAAKANDDLALAGELEAIAEAGETVAMSAYFIYTHLLRVYGAAKMDSWPYPGSETGNNPDMFTRSTKRKNSAGTAKVYWSDYFAEAFATVKQYRAFIAEAKDDAKAGRRGEIEVEGLEKKYDARISSIKTKIKNAISLHHQLAAADVYPGIKLEWETEKVPQWKLDDNGDYALDAKGNRIPVMDPKTKKQAVNKEVINSKTPLVLIDADTPTRFWHISIATLLGYDFDAATANGGTVESLMATARSGAEEENDNGGVNVKDMDTAIDMCAGLVNYLDNPTTYGKVTARLAVENDETLIELQTLDKLIEQLNGLVSRHRKRLDLAEDKESIAETVRNHAA